MINSGAENPAYASVLANLPATAGSPMPVAGATTDAAALLPAQRLLSLQRIADHPGVYGRGQVVCPACRWKRPWWPWRCCSSVRAWRWRAWRWRASKPSAELQRYIGSPALFAEGASREEARV